VKSEIREVIEAVRSEALERSTGAVVFQGFNTLLKALDTERRIREADELTRQVEELRELVEANKERDRRWG
jgi:archaellum component FlaC